ncbi:acyltransferase family protein [Georgenia sp. Z1344]|uniref:acyltransferase family protein n=1 Tax=Georgenia sp. Z1344 TaxID=3416706 RepID=UPI003CEEFC43
MSPGDESAQPSRGRVAWIDAARGFLVVLVVLGHTLYFMRMGGMPFPELEPAVRVAQAIRIPALFALSGALFLHAASRSWRTVIGTRIVPMAWVLGVWLLVELVVRSWRFSVATTLPDGVAAWALEQALLPEDYLWFIWALAVMTLMARLLRSYPVLIVAVALAMLLSPELPNLGRQTVPLFTYAPFFLIGFLVAPALRVRQRWLVVLGAISALCFIPLAIARNEFDLVLTNNRTDVVLLALLGLTAVALVGIGLSRIPGFALWSWLGRRTLPIYVAHMPLLLVGLWLVEGPARAFAEPRPGVVVLLLLVYAVGVPVLLRVVCDKLPFDGILAEPRWLRRLVLGDGGGGASARSARTEAAAPDDASGAPEAVEPPAPEDASGAHSPADPPDAADRAARERRGSSSG